MTLDGSPAPQPLVVLAAGRSARMGRSKPLLRWRGATFLENACAAARLGGAAPVLVVAEDPGSLRGQAGELGDIVWVACPTAALGQSESLRAGLGAALGAVPSAEAILVCLVDQVGMRPEAVRTLLEAVAHGGFDAWASDYGGSGQIPGHPVALGPATWPLVARLKGDVGARAILKGLGDRLAWVELPEPWQPLDCDTPEDYRLALVGSARVGGDQPR